MRSRSSDPVRVSLKGWLNVDDLTDSARECWRSRNPIRARLDEVLRHPRERSPNRQFAWSTSVSRMTACRLWKTCHSRSLEEKTHLFLPTWLSSTRSIRGSMDIRFLVTRGKYWILRPRFAMDSISARMYYYGHPDYPWVTRECIEILQSLGMREWDCFEWGSGRSTIYFAKRAKSVVSVESDMRWLEWVANQAKSKGLTNVNLKFVPLIDPPEIRSKANMVYPDSILEFPDESFDCVLIDGWFRNECLARTPRKLRPGGIAILDNSQCNHNESPFASWSRRDTSNGVTSTTIWTKPVDGGLSH